MITISLFKAIPQIAFRYNTHKMAIPWNEITVAFAAISDFEKEIQELQNQDQIASLLESPEAAPFLDYSKKTRQYKHELYESIRTAFMRFYEYQVLDNVLVTQYYSMNELYLTVIGRVAPYLQAGKECFESFRKDLEESISNQMVQNGILFLVLSAIDKAVKERFLLLHYDDVAVCWVCDE